MRCCCTCSCVERELKCERLCKPLFFFCLLVAFVPVRTLNLLFFYRVFFLLFVCFVVSTLFSKTWSWFFIVINVMNIRCPLSWPEAVLFFFFFPPFACCPTVIQNEETGDSSFSLSTYICACMYADELSSYADDSSLVVFIYLFVVSIKSLTGKKLHFSFSFLFY